MFLRTIPEPSVIKRDRRERGRGRIARHGEIGGPVRLAAKGDVAAAVVVSTTEIPRPWRAAWFRCGRGWRAVRCRVPGVFAGQQTAVYPPEATGRV